MALKVIGAGLGRTGTLSLKFALEHLGFDRCYHMGEVFADTDRNLPLWLDVVRGILEIVAPSGAEGANSLPRTNARGRRSTTVVDLPP